MSKYRSGPVFLDRAVLFQVCDRVLSCYEKPRSWFYANLKSFIVAN